MRHMTPPRPLLISVPLATLLVHVNSITLTTLSAPPHCNSVWVNMFHAFPSLVNCFVPQLASDLLFLHVIHVALPKEPSLIETQKRVINYTTSQTSQLKPATCGGVSS